MFRRYAGAARAWFYRLMLRDFFPFYCVLYLDRVRGCGRVFGLYGAPGIEGMIVRRFGCKSLADVCIGFLFTFYSDILIIVGDIDRGFRSE